MVGETPNLAARLQQVAEPNTAVVSASTRRRLGRVFELRPLDPVALKGFADLVTCWEVVGEAMVESRFAAAHDVALADLVGRESKLSLLMRRWQLACGSEGQLVLLSGQPGIGKSRLAETLCARIAGELHVRVLCQCSPHHTNSPLHPVLRMIERGAEFVPADEAATKLRKLRVLLRAGWRHARMLPLLASLLSITADMPSELANLDPVMRNADACDDGGNAQRTFAAATGAPADRRRPLDRSTTRDLFSHIAATVHENALLMLVNIRSEEGDVAWSGYPDATRLQLNAMDRRSAIELIEMTACAHRSSWR